MADSKLVPHWAQLVVKAERPRAKWNLSLSMATDCSGAATPELAWRALESKSAHAPSVTQWWACDIAPGPRAWLQRVLPGVALFADVVEREFKREDPNKTGIRGKVVGTGDSKERVLRDDANLDVYVAGFSCSPWSPRGKKKASLQKRPESFSTL